MWIAGDFRETVFNWFQVQFKVWLSRDNFVDLRRSVLCVLVNSCFGRFLIVGHSCFSFLRATEPPWEIRSLQSLYPDSWPNVNVPMYYAEIQERSAFYRNARER